MSRPITLHVIQPQEPAAPASKFHLSLHATDLSRAVAFYRALFGVEPAKQFDDYAKFELNDPPVVFSLSPHPAAPAGGPMSHAGLKVSSAAVIEATHARLAAAGYAVECQQGAVCGYRRQDKLHVADPDGTRWEVYVVEAEVEPESIQRGLDGAAAAVATAATRPTAGVAVVWEHFVTNPLPEQIPHEDASVDEVRMIGTFNSNLTTVQLRRLCEEARRVLKPGGKVLVHGLMSNRPIPGETPQLPGLAAMVSRVSIDAEPIEMLTGAGFIGLQITRYNDQPWFTHEGVELREVKLLAWRPATDGGNRRRVLYKGPFAKAADELGNVYPRGERVEVSAVAWDLLRRGAAAEQFLFLDLPSDAVGCCHE